MQKPLWEAAAPVHHDFHANFSIFFWFDLLAKLVYACKSFVNATAEVTCAKLWQTDRRTSVESPQDSCTLMYTLTASINMGQHWQNSVESVGDKQKEKQTQGWWLVYSCSVSLRWSQVYCRRNSSNPGFYSNNARKLQEAQRPDREDRLSGPCWKWILPWLFCITNNPI